MGIPSQQGSTSGGRQEKGRVLMTTPFETTNGEPGEPKAESKRSTAPEPTPAQITRAVAFLREALKDGPRLTREVEAEAQQQGHAHRTLVRAGREVTVTKPP